MTLGRSEEADSETDARDPAFLGRLCARRTDPPALQGHGQGVFPAPSVQPLHRLEEHRDVQGGKATLYSYVINHRPAPGFEKDAPYAIAVVELAEGPRMMTNIVDSEQTPEALPLDMALEVTFEKVSDTIHLPKFRPAKG